MRPSDLHRLARESAPGAHRGYPNLATTRHLRLDLNQRIRFFRQVSQLLQAGLPVLAALEVLRRDDSRSRLSRVLVHLANAVGEGRSLATAMADCGTVFTEFQCRMTEAGEATGRLDRVLLDIARQLDRQRELQKRIAGATRYPLGVLVFAAAVTLVMLWYVVPVFADLFAAGGSALPTPTRILLALSSALRDNRMALLNTLLAALLLVVLLMQSQGLRTHVAHTLLSRTPVLGIILRRVALARIAHLMALTLSAGVPMLQALTITAQACPEPAYRRALEQVGRNVQAGGSLYEGLSRHDLLFPPFFNQLVLSGEQSGQLDTMLERAAWLYEGSVSQRIDRLVTLLEPGIMAILAVIVGGLLAALYLPIFAMGNAF